MKGRVGADGHNPIHEEMKERLKNPDARKATLEKSIITRLDPEFVQKITMRPTVKKDNTIKIAT